GLVHVRQMQRLESLSLEAPITDKGLEYLIDLPALMRFMLVGSGFTDESAQSLAKFSRLKSISLAGTDITDAGIAVLAEANATQSQQLGFLSIRSNVLTDAGFCQLAKFTGVEELHVRSGNLSDGGCEAISKMPRLKELNVQLGERYPSSSNYFGDKITEKGFQHLTVLRQLEVLDLENMKLNSVCCEHIAKMKSLRELRFTWTTISKEEVDWLGEQLPETFICRVNGGVTHIPRNVGSADHYRRMEMQLEAYRRKNADGN
ncbi:MAG: hypothetical protein KDB27_23160, partial [Planctomycetales bacterium]|nr:hypothetical protein [Planctomycetales bacterium]